MNVFGNSSKQLLQALTANAEKETMDYVLQEMQAVLGEEMPEADAVRTYLQDPDKPTELSTAQQIVAPSPGAVQMRCGDPRFRLPAEPLH